MTEKEIKKIYYCEYCKKHFLTKGFAVFHEKWCKKNPNNQHKCLQYCKHLERGIEEAQISFYCSKIESMLYSYKAERKKHECLIDADFKRMPLECEFYEAQQGHENFYKEVILQEQRGETIEEALKGIW